MGRIPSIVAYVVAVVVHAIASIFAKGQEVADLHVEHIRKLADRPYANLLAMNQIAYVLPAHAHFLSQKRRVHVAHCHCYLDAFAYVHYSLLVPGSFQAMLLYWFTTAQHILFIYLALTEFSADIEGKRKGAEHPLCGQGALGVRVG